MSNALWWAPAIRGEGRVVDATDPGRMACVDPDDIARVAALTLTQDGHAGHGYILNGPQALTAREQVEILADVLGRAIDFVDVTPEQLARDSVQRGTPVEEAEAMRNLNELFRAGRSECSPTMSRTSPAPRRGPSATGANATSTPSAEARLTTHRRRGRRRGMKRGCSGSGARGETHVAFVPVTSCRAVVSERV